MVSEQDLRRIAAFVDGDERGASAVPTAVRPAADRGHARGVADD